MVNNMKNFRKLSLIIIAWFITMVQGIGMCGQIIKDTTKIRKDYYLYHRINAHNIESSYYGNSRTIDSVLRRMENSFLIDSIAIFSTTSPEGTDRINNRISTLRAEETQIVSLPSGDWNFETTDWSSKYDKNKLTFVPLGTGDEVQEPTDNFYNITRKHNFEFDLTFAKKQDSGIPYIRVYEFMKVNKLIPGGSNNN